MLGQPLAPLRPHLAAAQHAGRVSPEQVSIIERALAQVDRRGFDPADIDKGEQLLVGFADIHSITELRILAAQVIDRIDPDGTRPKDQLNHDRRHVEFHQMPRRILDRHPPTHRCPRRQTAGRPRTLSQATDQPGQRARTGG